MNYRKITSRLVDKITIHLSGQDFTLAVFGDWPGVTLQSTSIITGQSLEQTANLAQHLDKILLRSPVLSRWWRTIDQRCHLRCKQELGLAKAVLLVDMDC